MKKIPLLLKMKKGLLILGCGAAAILLAIVIFVLASDINA